MMLLRTSAGPRTWMSSSGLICGNASGRSPSAGIQVQCTGCPPRRRMLLIASTGSRVRESTMSGTGFCSVKALSVDAGIRDGKAAEKF